jgi:hypothetical protein
MDTTNMTTKELMDKLTVAAYDFAIARNRYEELHHLVQERLAAMREKVEEDKA